MRCIGRRALLLTTIGIAVGVAGTAALTQLLGTLLFELSPLDPATFLLAVLGLAATAIVAAFVPTLRATRVNPVTALSAEA
jgi:ABC-type antimicrobial peptide transport system permease subunit